LRENLISGVAGSFFYVLGVVDNALLLFNIAVMEIIRTIHEMQVYADQARGQGKIIGLVPTMGYLHEGHLSLVRQARKDSDIVIVSIFINPAQFGPGEDLVSYPRDFDSDRYLLEKEDVDVIFAPSVAEMYPEPSLTNVYVHKLTQTLCGAYRPGHLDGVSLVVAKLFNVTKPHKAFFGAKDFQQQVVIRRMVHDLNFDVQIVTCPIVREPDGLAMSSRNTYLSSDERRRALVLNHSLEEAERLVKAGERDAEVILKQIRGMILQQKPDRIDYISAVHPEALEDIKHIQGPVLFALAVRFGKTRLIDNRLVEP
jgi:pantoate--beta-alanine ligase